MDFQAIDEQLAAMSFDLERIVEIHGLLGLAFASYCQEAIIALQRAQLLLRDMEETEDTPRPKA